MQWANGIFYQKLKKRAKKWKSIRI
jgi:hypothetical protein